MTRNQDLLLARFSHVTSVEGSSSVHRHLGVIRTPTRERGVRPEDTTPRGWWQWWACLSILQWLDHLGSGPMPLCTSQPEMELLLEGDLMKPIQDLLCHGCPSHLMIQRIWHGQAVFAWIHSYQRHHRSRSSLTWTSDSNQPPCCGSQFSSQGTVFEVPSNTETNTGGQPTLWNVKNHTNSAWSN